MNRAGTEATVLRRPTCDICADGTEAFYDAATLVGPWAFLCEVHFRTHTRGRLGLGVGQRLLTPEEVAAQAVREEQGR